MKLVRIFVPNELEEGLWSVQWDEIQQSEFDTFFDNMHDTEWLYSFFEKNKGDLDSGFWGKITAGEAVLKTLEEAHAIEDALYDFTEKGVTVSGISLQHLFKPLNNFEYAILVHQKSKARVGKGWLRVYAIRLAENCYLITGGAIKLTLDMKRNHLQKELHKLEQVKYFLHHNGINYPEDLNLYHDE